MFEQFGNMFEMVKKVQQYVSQAEEKLAQETIEVVGSDVVKAVVNGQQSLISIELNAKYLSSENAILLQDMLVDSINNALTQSRNLHQATMSKLAGELNLPNIPGLF